MADRVDNIMTARNNNNNNGQGVAQGGNVGGGPQAVVNVAQAPLDNQNPPRFCNDSISGSTGSPPGQNYYGPPQAFNNGRYQPDSSNNHQHGHPYPNNNNNNGGHGNVHNGGNPGGNPGGGGYPGGGSYRDTYRAFPDLVMGFEKNEISLPMLPVPVQRCLLHAVTICGLPGKFTRVIEIDTMINTGAMIGTAKLSVVVAFCRKYTWLIKAMIDSADGEFQEIFLANAFGDRECLKTLSTTLPVLIETYTPWLRVSYGIPVTLMYACGELLSCRNIAGLAQLMDMGAQLELKLMHLLTPNCSCESLELILKEPTDQP